MAQDMSVLQQLPRFSPEQTNILNKLLQQGFQGVEKGVDFAPIEKQARQQFATQTVPGLAERFTAANGQRSSAFQGALGNAAANLESQLAQLRSQHGLQHAGLSSQLLQLGLTPQFENIYERKQEQPGFLSSLLGPVGQGAGSLGTLFGASKLGLLGSAGPAAESGASLGAGGAGLGASLSALAAQPWFLPLLAALGAGGGAYGAYKLFNMD